MATDMTAAVDSVSQPSTSLPPAERGAGGVVFDADGRVLKGDKSFEAGA